MCIFAHGVQELLMNQPALKVKKCRNYHTNGFCRYGLRCNFKHEKNAKPKKKKNQYRYHRMFNSYADVLLQPLMKPKLQTNSSALFDYGQKDSRST